MEIIKDGKMRLTLFLILSIALYWLVVGDSFLQMITSPGIWSIIAIPMLLVWIGIQCFEVDSRPVKIIGGGLISFLVIGFLAFWFVGRIRTTVCWYFGIGNLEEIFDYFRDISILQIIVLGVAETILGTLFFPKGNYDSDEPKNLNKNAENQK